MSSISRRDLLKNAAAGSAAVAALGMAGVASADEAAPAAGQHSWEVKPEPITEVSETVDCDVLIIGGGYSGCSCACNAAQNGLNTVLVEKDDVLNGHGVGGTGAVTGAICQNADGDYVQYNAAKGVVLATGDVSWNDEYLEEFAPIALQVKSRLCGDLGNVGDGHNMAAWAGAAFQPAPWPTMMHPQAAGMFHGPFLFINPEGKRFMNEATWVQGKCVGIMVNGGSNHAWSIFDSNFEADNTASLEFGGGMFWDSFRAVGSTPADASASHAKTVKEGVENTPDYYKCADTIEELVEQLDVPADVALETIAHYNELCEAGEDTDFYKESHFLFPIKQGPFYAVEVGPGLLGVCGGIQINDDFQAVDANNQPIEGLYAIGNCAGGMYAYDYPINIQGNSHGRCLMEGKCLAEQLAGVSE